jgi:hypothetical protein
LVKSFEWFILGQRYEASATVPHLRLQHRPNFGQVVDLQPLCFWAVEVALALEVVCPSLDLNWQPWHIYQANWFLEN